MSSNVYAKVYTNPYTKYESEKFKYIIDRLKRQDLHKTDEMLHNILTDKLWDMSKNVMHYGTDEEKSLMEDWAKDCEKRWNNVRWTDINDKKNQEVEGEVYCESCEYSLTLPEIVLGKGGIRWIDGKRRGEGKYQCDRCWNKTDREKWEEENVWCSYCEYSMTKFEFGLGRGLIMWSKGKNIKEGEYRCDECYLGEEDDEDEEEEEEE